MGVPVAALRHRPILDNRLQGPPRHQRQLSGVQEGGRLVLGRCRQLHAGGDGEAVAVHDGVLAATRRRVQRAKSQVPDYRGADFRQFADCSYVVSIYSLNLELIYSPVLVTICVRYCTCG